ncbi:hypothetical protein EYF80_008391 [Liparis tanakae]|uniref:Uncharacterized protein n=1 Tax=Liparis tanakae TaxID=230148 RepID=A0A4Z2ITX2_9TELE|nr:hypothetical protein EYF80_008391 [Liparis tanakae]
MTLTHRALLAGEEDTAVAAVSVGNADVVPICPVEFPGSRDHSLNSSPVDESSLDGLGADVRPVDTVLQSIVVHHGHVVDIRHVTLPPVHLFAFASVLVLQSVQYTSPPYIVTAKGCDSRVPSPESLQPNLTAGSHMCVTPSQFFSSLRSMQSVSPSQRQRRGMHSPSIRHWNSSM